MISREKHIVKRNGFRTYKDIVIFLAEFSQEALTKKDPWAIFTILTSLQS